jgi:hypothetical protein
MIIAMEANRQSDQSASVYVKRMPNGRPVRVRVIREDNTRVWLKYIDRKTPAVEPLSKRVFAAEYKLVFDETRNASS